MFYLFCFHRPHPLPSVLHRQFSCNSDSGSSCINAAMQARTYIVKLSSGEIKLNISDHKKVLRKWQQHQVFLAIVVNFQEELKIRNQATKYLQWVYATEKYPSSQSCNGTYRLTTGCSSNTFLIALSIQNASKLNKQKCFID